MTDPVEAHMSGGPSAPPPLDMTALTFRWFRKPSKSMVVLLAAVAAFAGGLTIVAIALSAPTWARVAVEDPHAGFLQAVSCAPNGLCMAYGTDNQVLTNQGGEGPWTVAPPLPGLSGDSIGDIGGVTCFDGGCLATTDVTVYLYRPTDPQWTPIWSSPSWWHVLSPTCTSNGAFCMAFANTNRTGQTSPPGGHEAVVTIANPTLVSGYGPKISVYRQTLYPVNWNGIWSGSCPTAQVCEGVSPNGVWRTIDAGRAWHLQLGLHSAFTAGGWRTVDCPTTSTCVVGAGAANFAITRDGGRSWRLVDTRWSNVMSDGLDESGSVNEVDCDTDSHCLAAISAGGSAPTGQDFRTGFVLESSNGGLSWSQQSVSEGADLSGIACTERIGCWTAGGSNAPNSNTTVLLHALER